jgi:hypothetical protein
LTTLWLTRGENGAQPPRGRAWLREIRGVVEAFVVVVIGPPITVFTDGMIVRAYQHLFDPQFGSIRDFELSTFKLINRASWALRIVHDIEPRSR